MNPPDRPTVPAISVEAGTEYVLGFPILVAVILHNDAADTDFLDLPELSPLLPIDSLAVTVQPVDGGPAVRIGPTFAFRDRDLFRTHLMAGETRRMLIDLTQYGQTLEPGRYTISLSLYIGPKVSCSSPPAEMALLAPSTEERTEADRLRRLGLRDNMVDTGSWQPFLTSNWNTVSISPALGETASRQVAFHMLLHRAAYGPDPLVDINLEEIRKIKGPVLSAESAALEYEVLTLRGNQAECQAARNRLLQIWPGLKTRFRQIDNNQGLLTTLRRGYGIEKPPPQPPGRKPYVVPGRR